MHEYNPPPQDYGRFDPSTLSDAEREAWSARVQRDGLDDAHNLFTTLAWGVSNRLARGLTPAAVMEVMIGEYHDMDILHSLGATFRHQTITLAKAMIRQALEQQTEKPQ
jgi:hypothetical protein